MVACSVIALDQLTKHWAVTSLADGHTVEVLPTIRFQLSFNSGMSFSAGAGWGHWIAVLVAAIVIVLVVVIVRETNTARTVLLALIVGGAVGNIVDRVARGDGGFLSGEVVDFINVTWFAVFNVADACVVLGGLGLVLHELFPKRHHLTSTLMPSDGCGHSAVMLATAALIAAEIAASTTALSTPRSFNTPVPASCSRSARRMCSVPT